jgi:hypothetical protein
MPYAMTYLFNYAAERIKPLPILSDDGEQNTGRVACATSSQAVATVVFGAHSDIARRIDASGCDHVVLPTSGRSIIIGRRSISFQYP